MSAVSTEPFSLSDVGNTINDNENEGSIQVSCAQGDDVPVDNSMSAGKADPTTDSPVDKHHIATMTETNHGIEPRKSWTEKSWALGSVPLHRLRSPWNITKSFSPRSLSLLSSNADSGALPESVSSDLVEENSICDSQCQTNTRNEEPIPRPFLNFSPLRKISAQCEAYGSMSKICVSGGLIVIGFESGLTVVFDLLQRKRCTCASEDAYGDARHKVTALDLSYDASFLAVGHASGHIFLYDVFEPKEPSRHVPPINKHTLAAGLGEGHLPDVPILHLHFVGKRKTGFISADAHGMCFYHSLGRMLGMASNDTLRVYGQYHGSLPIISALSLPMGTNKHASDNYNFVALLLQDKMLLIGLQPSAKTWYRAVAKVPSETAAMAWFPTTCTDGRVQHPMLAFAFGSDVRVLHVRSVRVKKKPSDYPIPLAIMLSEESLPPAQGAIIGLHWVHRSLLLVGTAQAWYLYDFRKQCYTEWQPHDPQLHERDEPGCQMQFFSIWRSKAFILAHDQVYSGDFVPWNARLKDMEEAHDYISAIQLALSFYNGTELGSGIGLPDSPSLQKAIIANHIQHLIDNAASELSSQNKHAPELVRLCARFAIVTQNFDYLFGDLYGTYESLDLEAIFVHEIERFILSGTIRKPPVSIMQRLLALRDKSCDYAKLEQLILHVDPLHFDIHQAMEICMEHNLWDGLAYICEEALQDYVTPIVKIVSYLQSLHTSSKENTQSTNSNTSDVPDPSAYVLFHIISARYQKLRYPSMEPWPSEDAINAVKSLNALLFSPHPFILPGQGALPSSDDEAYPYLRIIMKFDAEAFFNVLDLAFEQDSYGDDDDPDLLSRRAIMNTLYHICLQGDLPDLSVLFTALFAARNSAKYPQYLSISDSQAEWLFKTLTHGATRHVDCEFALECMLSAHPITYTPKHLDILERSQFWNIYESALKKTGQYEVLLHFYMLDRDGEHHTPGQLYARITSLFQLPALQQHKKWKHLEKAFIEFVPDVPETLIGDLARIVMTFFPSCDISVLEQLCGTHHYQYLYLMPFFVPEKGGSLEISPALCTAWINLVAEFSPTLFMHQLDAYPLSFFDLDQVSKVCEKHGLGHILIWAYDRQGHVDQALDTLDSYVARASHQIQVCIESDENSAGTAAGERNRNEYREAFTSVNNVVEMASRIGVEHSSRDPIDVNDVREHWFRVLNAVTTLEHVLTSRFASAPNELALLAFSHCETLLDKVLAALVTSVPFDIVSFPLLFKRLLGDDPKRPKRSFFEMRKVMNAMITAYRLRCDLLYLSSRLSMADVTRLFHELVRNRSSGWLVYATLLSCESCGRPLDYHERDENQADIIITPHGRLFHHDCFSGP